MDTKILNDVDKIVNDIPVDKKEYPIHQHGFINYYTIDDVEQSTDTILKSYNEHSDILGIG